MRPSRSTWIGRWVGSGPRPSWRRGEGGCSSSRVREGSRSPGCTINRARPRPMPGRSCPASSPVPCPRIAPPEPRIASGAWLATSNGSLDGAPTPARSSCGRRRFTRLAARANAASRRWPRCSTTTGGETWRRLASRRSRESHRWPAGPPESWPISPTMRSRRSRRGQTDRSPGWTASSCASSASSHRACWASPHRPTGRPTSTASWCPTAAIQKTIANSAPPPSRFST